MEFYIHRIYYRIIVYSYYSGVILLLMHGKILRYGRMGFERSETGKQALERRRSIGTNKYTCIPTFLIRLVMKGIIKWNSVKQNDYDHYGQFIDF
jgi:hypothetical protein